MTVDAVLERLEKVRRTSRGFVARCPVHMDRSPSLSIGEGEGGRILVHCFAGCNVQEICAAISLKVSELFSVSSTDRGCHRGTGRKAKQLGWEQTAFRFQLRALDLRLRAEKVLAAATYLDVSGWSDAERDLAVKAVGRAYADRERADLLEEVAFGIRARELEKGKRRGHHAATA